MTKIGTTTEQALLLLRRGWSVIPVHVPVSGGECSCGNDCSWPGKHPRVPWRPFTESRPTKAQVLEWFEDEFYGSNLGVVTGRVSNLVVVDLDGDFEQFESLGLPDTLTSRTGGGGFHFFYRLDGRPAPSGISVVPGIDIKADGGFVVLPPSRHKSGFEYAWIDDAYTRRFRLETVDPSELPKRARPEGENGEWVGELLSGVEEGERSSAAARMVGRYAQIGLTMDETVMLMESWNSLNDPPLPRRELGATIRSVYRRHRDRNPEQVKTLEDISRIFGEMRGAE